jgi:AAA+ superfamily predicted ATPase
MTQKNITKELLSSVQKVVSSVRGQDLNEELINSLRNETPLIMSFFEISHFQSIIFSLYLEYGVRDLEVDNGQLIDYVGKNMSAMADVNEALDELLAKKLVYAKTLEFANKRKQHNKSVTVHDKVLNALMKGDKSLLETPKVVNFFSLLAEVRDLIVKRIDLEISSCELGQEVRSVLETNKQLPEVKWLLSFENLSNHDLCMVLDLSIEHVEGAEEVDIAKLIREVFSELPDRVKYKKQIKQERCSLFKNDIFTFSDDDFSFLNYVRLSDTAMDILLGGYQDTVKKELRTKMGMIIVPEKIELENLFYNESEKEQISTLSNALEDSNYDNLIARMKENNMKAGFTVLLYGYPGTGKTSSVKQIAKATGRAIYMVEIEKIQSKWVGESEKNLAKVFEEYQSCRKFFSKDPILLFNEADAILGKRINVNNSVDKSFNALQNILLQELEDFEGIFMATTNLADQLDKAFDRRLLYKIDFKRPDTIVRKQILVNLFSDCDELVLDKLNQEYLLTGGQIANIKKKLLVKSILDAKVNKEDYLMTLCKDEFILNQNTRNPIGFLNQIN